MYFRCVLDVLHTSFKCVLYVLQFVFKYVSDMFQMGFVDLFLSIIFVLQHLSIKYKTIKIVSKCIFTDLSYFPLVFLLKLTHLTSQIF